MSSGSTSRPKAPNPLHGGTLHNRTPQQPQQQRGGGEGGGGMAAAPPPQAPLNPPYGYTGQPVPGFVATGGGGGGSPLSSSGHLAPLPPTLLEATTSKLLMPSRDALAALLAVPLLLWAAVVVAGTAAAEPIPEGLSRRDFEHPLSWFDRHVFRVWGPLLPLAPYLVRTAALGLRARPPARGGGGTAGSSMALVSAGRQLTPGMTLPLASLAVYVAVGVGRLALYAAHLELQRTMPEALVSDHLVLAASVVACFQSELLMCLSDIYKAELLRGVDRGAGWRQLAVVAALVGSMFALVFVYGDMYCTARWYHHPSECIAALAAGAVVFQAPVAVWLIRSARLSSSR